jgi:flagellar biogenesis protein FliO
VARDECGNDERADRLPLGGLAGWLLQKLRRAHRGRPRLTLVERITLAPRQSLALIEAEGRRLLVATSADGASAFYPLDEHRPAATRAILPTPGSAPATASMKTGTRRPHPPSRVTRNAPRVSW